MPIKKLEFEDYSFRYSDQGSGDVLVLLHGFCEDLTIWNDLAIELSSEFRVICIDLPGHGESSIIEDVSILIMSDIVFKVLDQENISECTVIGHSMGGYVAVEFAAENEDMINGLGFFHSSADEDPDEKKRDRTRLSTVSLNDHSNFVSILVPALFLEKNKRKFITEIERLTAIARSMKGEAVSEALLAMRDRRSHLELLTKVKYPVMFILGQDDPVLRLAELIDQVKMPLRSHTYITSEAAHMGFIEDRANCTQFILSFLRTVNSTKQ